MTLKWIKPVQKACRGGLVYKKKCRLEIFLKQQIQAKLEVKNDTP